MMHKRTHEKDDGKRPFSCEHCSRVYKYEESLKRHLKADHQRNLKEKLNFKISIFQYFPFQLAKFNLKNVHIVLSWETKNQ